MIRLAEEKDIDSLMLMCRSFFNVSGYSKETDYNEEDMQNLLYQLIEGECILTDGKDGVLAFVVFPMFVNNSHLVAQELFWWVNEDKRGTKLGVELLEKAEEQAKKLGANQMLMLSLSELNGNKVNRLYESKGYTQREVTYMRSL